MYNELYEAWKTEKENAEIPRLPKNFYARVANYLKKLREDSRMLDKKTTKAKLFKRELESVCNMTKELPQLRYRKILEKSFARKTISGEVLTEEEEKLYGDILYIAEAYHAFINDILHGRLSHIKKREEKKILRFIQAIPEIIGADMKTYGPFEPEDIGTLPSENARILIEQGAAIEVESDG